MCYSKKGVKNSNGYWQCENHPEKKFLWPFELASHKKEDDGEDCHINDNANSLEKIERDFILAQEGWKCGLDEVTFDHKFQLVNHWYLEHAKPGQIYEACQWCLELFDTYGKSLKVSKKVIKRLK